MTMESFWERSVKNKVHGVTEELDQNDMMHLELIYTVAKQMEEWHGWLEKEEESFTGDELRAMEDRLEEVFGEAHTALYEEGIIENDDICETILGKI